MSPLKRFFAGLRALFYKQRVEQELDEELRAYLEASIDEKMRAGVPREDASRAARFVTRRRLCSEPLYRVTKK